MKTTKTTTLALATLAVLSIGATVWATSTAHRPSVTYPSVTYGSRCGPAGTGTTWVSGTGGATTGVESLTIEQTEVSDNVWLPLTSPIYHTEADEGCRFECAEGYELDDGQECVSSIPPTGVSHDEVAGTITVSDGTQFYTIRDRNEGATVVGTWTAPETKGYHFQRGNNQGVLASINPTPVTSTRQNASAYGPSTYASGWVNQLQRDSSDNRNLRWGRGDTTSANGTGTQADRQGPCPDGYHIPSTLEWKGLISAWATSYGMTCNPPASSSCSWSTLTTGSMDTAAKVFAQFQSDFMFSMAAYRLPDGSLNNTNARCDYWSSSSSANAINAYSLNFGSSSVSPRNVNNRGYGFSLRCFQNS